MGNINSDDKFFLHLWAPPPIHTLIFSSNTSFVFQPAAPRGCFQLSTEHVRLWYSGLMVFIMSPLFGDFPFLFYGVDIGVLTGFSWTRLNILLVWKQGLS